MANSGKSGYVGKVSNSSAQVVKAPYSQGGKTKGGKVIRGEDLRNGRKGK